MKEKLQTLSVKKRIPINDGEASTKTELHREIQSLKYDCDFNKAKLSHELEYWKTVKAKILEIGIQKGIPLDKLHELNVVEEIILRLSLWQKEI